MISTQVPQDQTVLDELVKQAQSDASARMAEINLSQGRVTLLGSLRNATGGSMNFHDDKIWSGEIFQRYQDVVANGGNAAFSLLANIQNGIKSAVVYSGRNVNTGGQHQCGWLVAWSNPQDRHAMKVYVDCGPIAKYTNINWGSIETELNNSSHSDPSTGTVVQARIFPMEDPVHSGSDGIIIAEFK
ncbi:hypothetical protein SOVF_026410 [Spinacia oleracea]|nr:hypothetical protein SOVF_026410 [Spinacia oleracea]